jgi:hypothetical protein
MLTTVNAIERQERPITLKFRLSIRMARLRLQIGKEQQLSNLWLIAVATRAVRADQTSNACRWNHGGIGLSEHQHNGRNCSVSCAYRSSLLNWTKPNGVDQESRMSISGNEAGRDDDQRRS